ncbi:MAG: tagatose-bisphosphate aldolase [Chloroflexi bacterium OLB15]|nr:MAG: tagatose-bisphosphate aldolase [Chloroflexi bacterium OLB15]
MITPGKLRALEACSTKEGHFNVLAIDHRGNLWDALAKHTPVDDAFFTAFKRDTVELLAPYTSAILLDPIYGIAPGLSDGWLPGHVGLLCPLEVTDYTLHPGMRAFQPIPDWSVGKIKRVGANAVKLLLYYHPQAPNADTQLAITAAVVKDCAHYDIPLFLEPIVYSPDPAKTLSPTAYRDAVLEAASTFSGAGADVIKTQFPIDTANTPDEREWRSALRELDEACTAPWTLLSAGVGYDIFKRQAMLACEAGASGVIAGRAVWNEAVQMPDPAARRDLLRSVCAGRVRELNAICGAGRPWREKVNIASPSSGWIAGYEDL